MSNLDKHCGTVGQDILVDGTPDPLQNDEFLKTELSEGVAVGGEYCISHTSEALRS